MGRPKGSKNKRRLQLTGERIDAGKKQTPAQRMQLLQRQVVLLVAAGRPPETIAAVMDMPLDRLRSVFAHQLEYGRDIVLAEELMRLDAQSAGGKTAATKLMIATSGTPEDSSASRIEDDAAKTNHANIIDLALKRLNGGKNG